MSNYQKPDLIILIGQSGAGKTTISNLINWKKIVSSDLLKKEVFKSGMEENHENIHSVAMDLISQDPAWQAKKVLNETTEGTPLIFDGPRNPADIKFLMKRKKVEVVGVYAPRSERYKRVLSRENRSITKKQFMQRCVDEVLEAKLNDCLRLSTIFFFNNETHKQINEKVGELVKALTSGNFPELNFEKKSVQAEEFINNLPTRFTASKSIKKTMMEYFKQEEKRLRDYQKNKISTNKFFI